MATPNDPNDPIQKLRSAGVITPHPLPDEYAQILRRLGPDEINLLTSLSKDLQNAEKAAGKSVISCFIL